MEDTKQRVLDCLKQLGIPEFGHEVQDFDDLKEVHGLDSLDFVEFLMNVEKEFKIAINDEEAESLRNLGQVVEYIEKLRES